MPLYEFQCQQCGKRTEVLQRFEDPPPAACPACGGDLKKLFSAPAVQFKGSGFYVTDYGGKNTGKSEGSEGKAEKADKGEKGEKGEKESSGKKETAAATEPKSSGAASSSAPASSGSSGSSGGSSGKSGD